MTALEMAEIELAEAAVGLARMLESLRHPKHAEALEPLHSRMKRIISRRFAKQQAALLDEADPWLRKMAGQYSEADAATQAKLQAAVTARLRAGTALTEEWPEKDSAAYAATITAASIAATERMTADYAIGLAKDAGNTFAEAWLRQNGFSKLAKDIDSVTRDRMASAVADVYGSGGAYNDAVKAIKDSFAAMKDDRADMIARTELADAYNAAMLASAKEAGDLQKTWEPDGEACEEICVPNVEQGAIDLDEDFASGDDAPPAHPRCDCSLGFVKAGA